jgi:prepilin-type N-terminal cleavage/methylation domain-containing protein
MPSLFRSSATADASLPRATPWSSGFTLIELVISMAVMTFLLLLLSEVTGATGRAWQNSQSRTDTFQSSRTALEIIARELTPAVVDTRMQFVVAPGSILADQNVGAVNVASGSPAILWMAPIGTEGALYCVGYYLLRDQTRQFYRLQRIYIPPTFSPQTTSSGPTSSPVPSPYYPLMTNASNPLAASLLTSPTNANWFTQNWNANTFNEENTSNPPQSTDEVVSSAADGIIALWVQCLDALGNPIPLVCNSQIHPSSPLYFNSAAYFEMATSTPFDNGASFVYLARCAQSMKANRLPAAIDLTVVAVDATVFARGALPPTQTNVYNTSSGPLNGTLDVTTSLQTFQTQLQTNGIYNARVFTTRVKLTNGS